MFLSESVLISQRIKKQQYLFQVSIFVLISQRIEKPKKVSVSILISQNHLKIEKTTPEYAYQIKSEINTKKWLPKQKPLQNLQMSHLVTLIINHGSEP
jgi:hypothetical protein